MKKCKIDVNPSGKTIIFDETWHTYTIKGTKNRLKSCSSVLKSFKNPFDENFWSNIKAKQLNISQKEVLKMWEEKRNASTTLGNNIHEFCEGTLLKKVSPRAVNKFAKKLRDKMKPFLKDIYENYEIIGAEKIVFSEKLKIAGTIDLLIKKNNILYIYDWKTNEKIDQESFKNQTMLPPLNNLLDCNYNHYSLQLNLYKKLILEENYFPEINDIVMKLVHITAEGPIIYEIKDLNREINLMTNFINGLKFR